MIFDERNAFRLLEQLSFPRLGGTRDEKIAAELLKKHLRSMGLKAIEETFQTQTYQNIYASLETLTPFRRKYNVSVVGNTGSTPAKSIKEELVHLISSAPDEINKARNKIVITYNAINKTLYQ